MDERIETEENENDWPRNYFNYFTEIEDHFQRARGTSLFLMSPLDWALIESWKNAGVPLEAVHKGIDDAFEKWRSRKSKHRAVNSVAYCAQAVMGAAQHTAIKRPGARPGSYSLFAAEQIRTHLENAAKMLRASPDALWQEMASNLEELAANAEQHLHNLEDLERKLTAMEDKMVAGARTLQSDEDIYNIRAALDAELRPYRGKMTSDQLALLERRYMDSAALERFKLPRLSLFYLR